MLEEAMRVISGTAKRTLLFSLDGLETRPTADRIKETIFNIIHNKISESYFLDLFSGSGAMGIEALSRNAQKVFFVEKSPAAMDIIKKNLSKTKLNENAVCILDDALNFLRKYAEKNAEKFDIIFLDPPYGTDYIKDVLLLIRDSKILNNEGIIIVEQENTSEILDIEGFYNYRTLNYKITDVVFYKQGESD